MSAPSAEARLDEFIDKFTPVIAAQTRAALAKLKESLPGAVVLVYDNYNALAIGFGPTDRSSDAILSIAVFPRWLSLFFLKDGPRLPDPKHLLKGGGKQARHIVLNSADDLDLPPVRALIGEALRLAEPPLESGNASRLVIKSVSANQRPRRPPED